MKIKKAPDFTWQDIFGQNILEGKEFVYVKPNGEKIYGISENVVLHFHGSECKVTLASLVKYGITKGKESIFWSSHCKETIDFCLMNDYKKWAIFLTLEPIEQARGVIKLTSDQKRHKGEVIIFSLKNDSWQTAANYEY